MIDMNNFQYIGSSPNEDITSDVEITKSLTGTSGKTEQIVKHYTIFPVVNLLESLITVVGYYVVKRGPVTEAIEKIIMTIKM